MKNVNVINWFINQSLIVSLIDLPWKIFEQSRLFVYAFLFPIILSGVCVLHLPHNVSCWRRRRRRRCTHALKNRFHAQALSSVYRSTLSPPLLNSGQHLISSCRKESQSCNFQFATRYAIDVIVTESILPAKNISLSCAPSRYIR